MSKNADFSLPAPDFRRPTYIVLDAPPALKAYVVGLREQFHPELAGLPVEITLTGSSGVGCLAADTQADRLFEQLGALAATTAPVSLGFPFVAAFPNSPVHYLVPEPAAPLHALHRRLTQLELCFGSSPFPFSPHLTIAWIPAERLADRQVLLAEVPPADTFVFGSLAVYSQRGHDTRLHFRAPFKVR